MIPMWIIYAILISILVIFLYYVYRKNFKILVTPSVTLITGAPKTGKSLLSVKLSIKDYKKRHRKWWFATKVLKKDIEEPLFYTNCKISFGKLNSNKPHKLDKNIRGVTTDLFLRKERFAYGSVIYINESSLMADNMDFADKNRNAELSLFNKLIAHETRGGSIYYDTQSVLDNHYSIKRVTSIYYFIEKKLNLFFFMILYVREMINSDNGVNNFTDDVETTTRKVFIPRWYFKKYDRYEFSYLTDDLAIYNGKFIARNGLVSFNPLYRDLANKSLKKGDNENVN